MMGEDGKSSPGKGNSHWKWRHRGGLSAATPNTPGFPFLLLFLRQIKRTSHRRSCRTADVERARDEEISREVLKKKLGLPLWPLRELDGTT